MNIKVTQELLDILGNIKKENKTLVEWSEIESDDMFQSNNFVGGYDADEAAFCFSFYDSNRNEFWFQFTLEDVDEILSGNLVELVARPAE